MSYEKAAAETLTNGFDQAGTLVLNTTNFYTFYATNGDAVLLRMGAPSFRPRIDLYAPDGSFIQANAGSGSSAREAYLPVTAETNGTFSVGLSSYYGDGSGDYAITLARVPGEFTVAPGDEGGSLTNGVSQSGTIALGDMDMWSFMASVGDNIEVRMGADFRPSIHLYGPDGAEVAAGAGGSSSAKDAHVFVSADSDGIYTAVVESYYNSSSGPYTLHLARTPGEFEVSPNDEGGTLTNGAMTSSTITVGDLDLWSFNATNGDAILIRVGSPDMRPWIRLFDPTGALVKEATGSLSSDTDTAIATTASDTGTFTVVVQGYYDNATSAYTLNLARIPGAFVVSPGDEGGTLNNGVAQVGTIELGDLDLWTFSANSGDGIALRVGDSGFRPHLNLYGPDGALLETSAGSLSTDTDTRIVTEVSSTGKFTVVLQSYYNSKSGPYTLSLARIPGTFTVSPGDEGGTLISGAANHATNVVGDLDIWTFDADAGDNIALRVGAPEYRPELSLYGPDGALLDTTAGGLSSSRDTAIFAQAANSGTFTVIEQGYYNNANGPYTLTLARFPGTFVTSAGDEGGSLTNGISQDGAIALGDLDLWSFSACKGYPITLTCEKLSGTFTPRIRLYGRDGTLLETVENSTTATLSFPGNNSGSFTALIDGGNYNDDGTYRLIAYGIHDDALSVCPPIVSGTDLNLTGYGGNAGSTFVIVTATNVTTPLAQWTPFLTNQFDTYGGFDKTNTFNGGEPERYFRIRTQW